jgi:multidrug efflux pump subunit AcrB
MLRWRYLAIAAFLSLMIITTGLVAFGWIKSQFMPEVEGDVLSAKLEMAQGVPFAQTQEAVARLETAARQMEKDFVSQQGRSVVKHVLASAGTQPFLMDMVSLSTPQASHLGEVTLELRASSERGVSAEFLANEWRERAGSLPGAVKLTFRAETAAGGNAIDFLLTSRDLQQLEQATAYVKEKLAEYQGVVDISDSNSLGKDEWRLLRLTPLAESLGLRLDDVAAQLRDGFYGSEVQRFQRGRDEVKVMVRYTDHERHEMASLEEMKIRTADGAMVPLLQVAVFERGRGPSSIQRTDRERSIKVMADVVNANANEVVTKFTTEVLDNLSHTFPGVSYDYEGEQKDQRDSVREIGTKFLFALLIMYVLIAIPLKSYFQPLIILGVIPFGVVGAIWGHVALGMSLSIMSLVGVVALAGVVVNDSLVMVDFINDYRDAGGSEIEAAELAGARRFRAIFLTSVTTFLGLFPMLMETDMQARFLVPMAVSLGFGSLFSTVIMLYLVPCIYLVMGDIRDLLGRLFRARV